MGTTKIFLTYIGNATVGELYPEECFALMDQYMNWFESILRPSARRVIQSILDPKKKSECFQTWMEHEQEDSEAKQTFF